MTSQTQSSIIDVANELKNNWAFWLFKHDKAKTYFENIKLISTVKSIEEFWRLG